MEEKKEEKIKLHLPTYKDLFPEDIVRKIEELAEKYYDPNLPEADTEIERIINREEAEALQPDEDLE